MFRQILVSMLLIGTSFACVTVPKHSVWFPFEMKREKIRFPIGVKRETNIPAILDTGAGITVIDSALARRLGIRANDRAWMESLADSKYVEYAMGVPFNFYGAEIRLNVMIQDISFLGVEVLFGADLLRAAVVEFDFPEQKMRFHNLGGYFYAGPTKPIPLIRNQGRYDIEIDVNGKKTALTVDTGASGSISIPVSKEEVQAKIKGGASLRTIRGANAESTEAFTEAAKPFQIGSYTIGNASVEYYDRKDGGKIGGLLGMSLLKEFTVIFDTDHEAMYIEAYEQ